MKKKLASISFNEQLIGHKSHLPHQHFIWVSNESGKLVLNNKYSFTLLKQDIKNIDKESIIIISDRQEKADDNGEHFFRWVKKNHPEYKNIYFAINKSSSHFSRLKAEGFNLLDRESKQFRNMYKQADVLVSSTLSEDFENHRAYRYFSKLKMKNSKYILLQHGVTYSARDVDRIVASKQKANYFVLSNNFEKSLFDNSNIWFQEQLPLIGMSRTLSTKTKLVKNNTILYMPSWTHEAFNCSDVTTTLLYKEINSLILNYSFQSFLSNNSLKLKLVLHPQIADGISQWEKLQSDNVTVVQGAGILYQEEIERSKFLITNNSSIFFDAIYKNVPIAFYQPYGTTQKNSGFEYNNVTQVCTQVEEIIDEIKNYVIDGNEQFIDPCFKLADTSQINERIWELIING